MSQSLREDTIQPPGLAALADAPANIFEAVPSAMCILDAAGRIVRWNRRASMLWCVAPQPGERLEALWDRSGIHKNGRRLAFSETPVAWVLQTGLPVAEQELEIQFPDGSHAAFLVSCEPLRDRQGQPAGVIFCSQNITETVRTRSALRGSLQDLEDFFENGAVGLHLVGNDGTILRANQAELDLLGYTREEYIGRSIRDFHADKPVIADILRRLVRGEKLDKYPARLIAKDGSIRHVLITSNGNIRNGAFINSRCFTVDVTAWRQSQELKKEAEQRLAATYEAAPIGIAEVDAQGSLVHLNGAFERIFGRSRQELLGLNFQSIIHPEGSGADNDCQPPAAGAADQNSAVLRHQRRDGSEVFLRILSSVVQDENGQVRSGVRIVEDVTESKKAQDLLAQSERISRELLEALPIAIYTTDMEGRIDFYNQAAVQFAGRQPELGRDKWCVIWRLYDADGTPMPHEECPMAQTLRHGTEVRGIIAYAERPDGTRVPFMPFPKLLRNAAGEAVGAINMLVDMTERKRAEDEQRVLIDELNHRVKNTLAMVQSIAAQTMRSTPENFARNFESRLMALSAAHNLLTRRRWTGVGLGELLESQLAAFAADDGRIRLAGPDVSLSPRVGVLLGMLIHELATNAAKYGALSQPEGTVRLDWSVSPNETGKQHLQLVWLERSGPEVVPPSRKGFGTRLLERSVKMDLRGKCDLHFDPAGVQCCLDVPLD